MNKPSLISLWLAAAVSVGCAKTSADTSAPAGDAANSTTPAPTDAAATGSVDADALQAAIAGAHRSAENKARDQYRHPLETLTFFGVQPNHTVIELWPGGGWYTEILGPYLKDKGKLIVTIADPKGPPGYYGTRQAIAMQQRFANESAVLGTVQTVVVPQDVTLDDKGQVKDVVVKPFELAAEGTADVVLTFRNSHGWYERDAQEMIYGAAFKALKPGGVFGVVQHRAPEGGDPKQWAGKGYLPESVVIEAAKAVGFELAEKSEVNANPKDTKDHPKGVWNLPPSLEDGEKDKAKYMAIGESDRMTLKFVKPR